MAVNGTSNVLVCGGEDGLLTLRALWNLDILWIIDHSPHGGIQSLCFTDDAQYLLIGSADGIFSVGTDPELRWKVLHAAIQKTPLLGPSV
jgi:WD40 repeat protein